MRGKLCASPPGAAEWGTAAQARLRTGPRTLPELRQRTEAHRRDPGDAGDQKDPHALGSTGSGSAALASPWAAAASGHRVKRQTRPCRGPEKKAIELPVPSSRCAPARRPSIRARVSSKEHAVADQQSHATLRRHGLSAKARVVRPSTHLNFDVVNAACELAEQLNDRKINQRRTARWSEIPRCHLSIDVLTAVSDGST